MFLVFPCFSPYWLLYNILKELNVNITTKELEENGIIGPKDNSNYRKVLLNNESKEEN